MTTYRFYKDEEGWFVDLPDSPFTKGELQMVMGADTFLDILAQGDSEVYVNISRQQFVGSDTLHYECQGLLEGPEYGEGAWYFLNEYQGISYTIRLWLCDVTKYVFGDFPMKIFFSRSH
jgi:hypothetical protein